MQGKSMKTGSKIKSSKTIQKAFIKTKQQNIQRKLLDSFQERPIHQLEGSYVVVRDRFDADGKFPQYSVPTESD